MEIISSLVKVNEVIRTKKVEELNNSTYLKSMAVVNENIKKNLSFRALRALLII